MVFGIQSRSKEVANQISGPSDEVTGAAGRPDEFKHENLDKKIH